MSEIEEISNLQALEKVMAEFFNFSATNERRQEIEVMLENFKYQQGCWKLCFTFLAGSECQYSSMFCLNTIEDLVNKQWICLPWTEKTEIKMLLGSFVSHKHKTLSPCLLSKSVKLVVDIARLDWPHFYPEFFADIIHNLRENHSRHLGLIFLLITYEELIAPREDLTFDRKLELKKLLIDQIPEVLPLLFEFLQNDIVMTNPEDGCLILKILTNLFSWVPASQVPNDLISIIFKLSANVKDEETAILALGTLNEMLYRHWLPPNYSQIAFLTLELTQSLLSSPLDEINEIYMEKFIEFLRLVVHLQLSQSQTLQNNNTQALFSAVINFTASQPTLVPGFASCLRIWLHFLDNSNSNKYCDAFLTLVPQILNKIQFRLNASSLESIDDKVVDDDGETEWKKFIKPCIEIIVKIAEMTSMLVIRPVFEKWEELCQAYVGALPSLSLENFDSLQLVMRDLATFTQIVGCFQSICSGENWIEERTFNMSRLTFQHLLNLNDLGTNIQYHAIAPEMGLSFEKLHAEILASVQSWCCWLPLLRSETCTEPILDDFSVKVVNGCIPYLNMNSPKILQHYSALVLSTITSMVRTGKLCEMESLNCLYTNRLMHLDIEDQYLLQGALVNSLILRWRFPDHLWDDRLVTLSAYIDELTAPFPSLPLEFNLENKAVIVSALRMMRNIIKLYKCEGLKTKTLVCLAFQKQAERALALFPYYAQDTQINEEIFRFFSDVMECLQHQIGINFTQVAIRTFMDSLSKERIQDIISSENGGGIQYLLYILALVIQTPGLSDSKITSLAVNWCIELFDPTLADTSSAIVQEALFNLVYSVLLHKWSYFFSKTGDNSLRSSEYLSLLKAIGQSFFLENIDLFKQNLEAIEQLNSKWKLYSERAFREELYPQYLSSLLNILIEKRHSLLNDEVVMVICNLVLVNIQNFHENFLPRFLNGFERLDHYQKTTLHRNFQMDSDIPSVIQNINRLTNDLICYQVCNTHFPKGPEAMA